MSQANATSAPPIAEPARPSPKISLGSWAFSFGPFEQNPWDFDRFCEYAATRGYDGIEINGFRPHPHDFDASASSLRNLGNRIAGLGLGISGYAPDFRSTPPAEVAESEYLKRVASVSTFCEALGISTVRVDTVTPPDGPSDVGESYKRLVRAWQRSADQLAASDIQLVWEFEPGFWLNRPSRVLQLVQDVDRPNFGLLFDTSHAHTGAAYGARQGDDPEILAGGSAEYARLVAPAVRHLHVIDSDGSLHDEDTSDHLPFGTGEVDFDAVLDALGPVAAALSWWTVDFCFCPTTEWDAASAVPVVREMRDRFLSRLSKQGAPA